MKEDDSGIKKGLPDPISKSIKGSGCCPTLNSCCCPESKTEAKGKKENASSKHLDIEWKHFLVGDATCERCGKTSEALNVAVEDLRRELAPSGVKISLIETPLDKMRIAESNEIRMNGVLLEDLLDATVVSTYCPSCSTLAGENTCCRATEIGDDRYEDVPAWAIKKAAYKILGIDMRPQQIEKSCCGD